MNVYNSIYTMRKSGKLSTRIADRKLAMLASPSKVWIYADSIAIADKAIASEWRAKDAHDIVRLNHTGWYCDEFQSETVHGVVWQMPARNHSPIYLAGYAYSDQDTIGISASNGRLDTFDNERDAALCADECARICSEHDRENDEIQNGLADSRDALAQSAEQARLIVSALREQKKLGALGALVCGMLREKFADARKEMHKAIDGLTEWKARDESHASYSRRFYAECTR